MKALEYVKNKKLKEAKKNIGTCNSCFTDSKNAIKLLTMTYHPSKYSLIVNRIYNYIFSLDASNLELHCIPSHVSYRNEDFQKTTVKRNEMAYTLAKYSADSKLRKCYKC